jgi:hypothetical protein
MVTPVAPVKLVPVIVTAVPPVVAPFVGLMLVTVGSGGRHVTVPVAFMEPSPPVTDIERRVIPEDTV